MLLGSMLLLFLVLNAFPYHFRIQANGVNTGASGPKMITPIGLFLEVSKFDDLVKSLLNCHCEERSDEAIS